MSDNGIVERISNVISTRKDRSGVVNDVDFINHWDIVTYMCKFPRHPDTVEIKSIVTEEFIEDSEYNISLSKVNYDYDINKGDADWAFEYPHQNIF